MAPEMSHGDGEECVEAYGATFPADHQAAVWALEPGKRPLGLMARDVLFKEGPPRLAGRPYPWGNLRSDPPLTEPLAKVLGVTYP
jgi:hypothetical protein